MKRKKKGRKKGKGNKEGKKGNEEGDMDYRKGGKGRRGRRQEVIEKKTWRQEVAGDRKNICS